MSLIGKHLNEDVWYKFNLMVNIKKIMKISYSNNIGKFGYFFGHNVRRYFSGIFFVFKDIVLEKGNKKVI